MIEFLGRTEELALLRDAISDSGERAIFVISGPGGIGKTRLLQELSVIGRAIPGARVLEIIDFDLPTYEIPQIIGRTIARQFPTAVFAPYLESIYLRQMAEEGGIDPVRLAAQTLDVNRKFVESFNRASAGSRVVLRFDTIEKMQGQVSFNRVLDLIFQLNNVVVAFAGRPRGDDPGLGSNNSAGAEGTDALFEQLTQRSDGRMLLKQLVLQPFDQLTFQAYVDKKQQALGTQLDQATRDALAVLAGGRPVLIDLAVELGTQVTAAAWLDELKRDPAELRRLQASPLPEDQAAFAAIQQRFDRELVAGIAASEGGPPRLGSRIDQLTVLLALVAPLDQDSIATILGLPPEQAGALFDEAGRRVSFKVIDNTLIRLHDAVRDLVLAHVLPVVDPDQRLQRTYLAQAIDAFENQSHAILARVGRLRADEEIARGAGDRDHGLLLFEERAAQQRRHQQARLRIVECAFRLDPIRGAERLERELEIARQHGGTAADLGAMFSTIRAYFPELERRSPPHYIQAQMALANQQIADGQYQLAEEIFDQLDGRVTEPTAQRFDILHGHGNVQMGIGQAQQALKRYHEAAELARQLGDDLLLGRALLSSAWAARLQGQLDLAIGYYQQAFGLTIRPGVPHDEAQARRATALNGMAYIYAIQGKKSRTAVDSLKQAIDIRQGLGESGRFALGQSYTTAGEIHVNLEQPQEALKYLALADDLFAELGSHAAQGGARASKQHNQWIAKIASARGRAYRDLGEESADGAERRAYLQRAETELHKAVELAIAADLPLARYRLGHVQACTPASRPAAVSTWQQSYGDARSFGDIATELYSVCQLARMMVYGLESGYSDYQSLDAWLQQYHERNPRAAFQIGEGRFAVYLGCLALQSGDADGATDYFQRGLGVLVEQPKRRMFSFDWHLTFLEQDVLPTCEPATTRTVWRRLLEDWMTQCKGVEAWTTFERWRNWPG
jgi:tetratricopeptide (TPR) repeat protein